MIRHIPFKLVLIIPFIFTISAVSAPDFSLIGYGKGTTGGAGGKEVTISSLSALEAWAKAREKNETPEIVIISGKISGSGLVTIKRGSNFTIKGKGTSGELAGVGLNIRDCNNVIVQNLKIHEVKYPNDALTLDNVQKGWVDHCELHSKMGSGIGQDTYDGLLDIKKGSAGITISWCYLHDHMKCNLIGHTNNTKQKDQDSKFRVTEHHNYFYNTNGRNPSIRFGAIHLFNNYYGKIGDYGIAARLGAHVKVENCHYEDVKLPMSTSKFPVSGLPDGYICQSGNIFDGSCGKNVIKQTDCGFWNNLPYSYKLDDVKTVKETVKKYAGVTNASVAILEGNSTIRSTIRQEDVMSVHLKSVGSLLPTGQRYDLTGKLLTSKDIKGQSHRSGIILVRKNQVQ